MFCTFIFAVLLRKNNLFLSITIHLFSTAMKTFRGHDVDLLGSRDVIGHVTIGLSVGTFLLAVNDDHAFILHRYGNIGSRDVMGHMTIGLGICGFLLVVHCNHAYTLHCYRDIKPQTCF